MAKSFVIHGYNTVNKQKGVIVKAIVNKTDILYYDPSFFEENQVVVRNGLITEGELIKIEE